MIKFVKNNSIFKYIIALIFVIVLTVLLFFIWQNQSEELVLWQYDSEGLVMGRVYQMQTGTNASNAGAMLGAYSPKDTTYEKELALYEQRSIFFDDIAVEDDEYIVYAHQSGMHGTVWGMFNLALCFLQVSSHTRLEIMHFVSVFLFSSSLSLLLFWVYKEFSKFACVFSGVVFLFSTWTIRAMTNLYWQYYLYIFILAISAILCYNYNNCKCAKINKFLLILLIFAMYYRFLGGFEFTSWIMIIVQIPLVFYFIKTNDKTQKFKWFKFAIKLALLELFAFAAALCTWFVQLILHTGEINSAINVFLTPILSRTALGQTSAISAEASTSFLQILNMYFVQENFILNLNILLLIIIYLLIFVIALIFVKNDKEKINRHISMFGAVVLSVLAVISWLFLAQQHSAAHAHIIFILFTCPFLLLAAAHIAICIKDMYNHFKLLHEKSKGNTHG